MCVPDISSRRRLSIRESVSGCLVHPFFLPSFHSFLSVCLSGSSPETQIDTHTHAPAPDPLIASCVWLANNNTHSRLHRQPIPCLTPCFISPTDRFTCTHTANTSALPLSRQVCDVCVCVWVQGVAQAHKKRRQVIDFALPEEEILRLLSLTGSLFCVSTSDPVPASSSHPPVCRFSTCVSAT